MKAPALLAGLLVLGIGAFLFAENQKDRQNESIQTPQVTEQPAAVTAAELATPPPVVVEETSAVTPAGDLDARPVGPEGRPLSYDDPQISRNGDGTITMQKMAKLTFPDGTVREVPVTVRARPTIMPVTAVTTRPIPPGQAKSAKAEATRGNPVPEEDAEDDSSTTPER